MVPKWIPVVLLAIALCSAVAEGLIKRLSQLTLSEIYKDWAFSALVLAVSTELALLWCAYRYGMMKVCIMVTISVVGGVLFGTLIGLGIYKESVNTTQVAFIIAAVFCCAVVLAGKIPGF